MDYDRGRVFQCAILSERRGQPLNITRVNILLTRNIIFMLSCELSFFTDNKQLMKRHPSFYAPHNNARLVATEQGIYRGSDAAYVKVNANPQQVDPELHLSKWEQEDSLLFWITKKKPKPSTAAGSAQQFIPSINLPILQSALTFYLEINPACILHL